MLGRRNACKGVGVDTRVQRVETNGFTPRQSSVAIAYQRQKKNLYLTDVMIEYKRRIK